jgi:DNA (cytosine-5)-methyltransferase 1
MQDLPEELWHESFRYYVKEDPERVGGPNLRMIRLDPQKPSLTVTGYVFNKFVHLYENRFITVREAARLQGFPDEMKFEGNLSETQLQVGNAVPVPPAKAVFESILAHAESIGLPNILYAMSCFSGAGGMDIGAMSAQKSHRRIETLLSFDSWDNACLSLSGYLNAVQSPGKVLKFNILDINNPAYFWHEHTGFAHKPHIIYGGPPCQSFSQAGKQLAEYDERGTLIYEFVGLISALRPLYFVMENVPNLRAVRGGELYKDVLERFDDMDYNLTENLLLAADFGVPQLRRRILLVGARKEMGRVSPPSPTHSSDPGLFGLKPYRTVGDAFQGLPAILD